MFPVLGSPPEPKGRTLQPWAHPLRLPPTPRKGLGLSPAGLPQSLDTEGDAEAPWSDTRQGGSGSEPLGSLLSSVDSDRTLVLTAPAPPKPW